MSEIEKLQKENLELQRKLNLSNAKGIKIKSDLALIQDLPQEFKVEKAKMDFLLSQAKLFIASGAFPAISPEQAFVIMKAGQEMGLTELQSLGDLYVVKGRIEFHGKGLVSRVTSAGYILEYTDETKDGVTVTIASKDDVEVYRESVKAIELENSNAMKIVPLEKMRYHAIRRIVKFYLPHLVASVGVGDPSIEELQVISVSDALPALEVDSLEYKNLIKSLALGDLDTIEDARTVYSINSALENQIVEDVKAFDVEDLKTA